MNRRHKAIALAGDPRGAALVEFAIVAPVLCLLLIGSFDVAHALYLRAVMEGAMQKASRDSTLESNDPQSAAAALNASVEDQVAYLVPADADISFDRRFYRTFSEAAAQTPEEFRDTNANQRCDEGESYEDANLNNVWDADGGNEGQGGAKDAVLYRVTVKYDAIFPLWKMIGSSQHREVAATTVLRNQPYNDQGSYAAAIWRNCS
ncbi:pilus assembly protein [Sphingomonas sp. S1-29]|uniref:TadE/TadG family type IV pilus assembly protein n=1 Tax=Sphingomonas sp. S1-29 TaxID=2991074 RepID=UPI00223F922E|nr:TadE/TadG family type IV pilus assembly protein [Sphingomonas sp. S1-29]UZK70117.1 pilus assembly protein [Sphingomonas sp. S1-29]